MLARVLAMARRLSVTSRSSIETTERIELVFGMGASFHLSYNVLKGSTGKSQINGTSLRNSVPNSGLKIFCFGISVVETCYRLSSTRWSPVVGQLRSTKLAIPPSSDGRLLVYHSTHQALSTARFRRAARGSISDS